MKFLRDKKRPSPVVASPADFFAFQDKLEVHHSVVAFCNNLDMDTVARSSSIMNPHNTRYIIAVEFKDIAVQDAAVCVIDNWLIVETRYFFVDFFRKVIDHILCKGASYSRLEEAQERQI